MVQNNLKIGYILVISFSVIVFIGFLVYKVYSFEQRLKIVEVKLGILDPIVQSVYEESGYEPDRTLVSQTLKIEGIPGKIKEDNVVSFKKSENGVDIIVESSGKEIPILKYREGDLTQPDHVDICGISFFKYSDCIVIKDQETGEIIPLSLTSQRVIKMLKDVENIYGNITTLHDEFTSLEKRFTEISTALGNMLSKDNLNEVSSKLVQIDSSIVDINERIRIMGDTFSNRMSLFQGQIATSLSDELSKITSKLDDSLSQVSGKIDSTISQNAKTNADAKSLAEKVLLVETLMKNALKFVAKVSQSGELIPINVSIPDLDFVCTKEKGRSIYAVFFDKKYVKGIPLIGIIPICSSGADSITVNIIKITERYVQYRLSSAVTGVEKDSESYITIEVS